MSSTYSRDDIVLNSKEVQTKEKCDICVARNLKITGMLQNPTTEFNRLCLKPDNNCRLDETLEIAKMERHKRDDVLDRFNRNCSKRHSPLPKNFLELINNEILG